MKNKGGRPAGEKTRCSGQWTESRYNSFIISLLRQGSRRWAPIQQVKKEANTKRGFYLCASCKEEVPLTIKEGRKRVQNIFVDHIDPIVDPEVGFVNWDTYVERMFCEKDKLQLLCKKCHDIKSMYERGVATERRRKEKNEAEL